MKRFRSCYQPQMGFGPGDEAVDPIYSPVALTPPPHKDHQSWQGTPCQTPVKYCLY